MLREYCALLIARRHSAKAHRKFDLVHVRRVLFGHATILSNEVHDLPKSCNQAILRRHWLRRRSKFEQAEFVPGNELAKAFRGHAHRPCSLVAFEERAAPPPCDARADPRSEAGPVASAANELLDLRPEDQRFLLRDLDARRVDGVLDELQHLLRDGLGQDLERFLERVNGVDQVDIEVVDVDELAGHQDEALVADLLDLAVLDNRVRDDVLANLLDLFLARCRGSASRMIFGISTLFMTSGSMLPGIAFSIVWSCRICAFRSFRSDSMIFRTRRCRRLLEALDHQLAERWSVIVGSLRLELEVRRDHLLHQQRRGDRLEHVVHRDLDFVVAGVRLGDEVRELGVRLVAGCRACSGR